MSRPALGCHKNVVSIRPGYDERITLADLQEHVHSMEGIMDAFSDEPGGVHTGRYLLKEALKMTPIIAEQVPQELKDRLTRLYQQLGELDQKYQGQSVDQILDKDPRLAAYLRENGFGPENI
jgi:hypothetical protein